VPLRCRLDLHATRTKDLVRHELHSHCQVQRQIRLIGRDTDQDVSRLQVLVAQSRALGTEEHGGGRSLRFDNEALRCIANVGYPEVLIAIARRRCRHETAARQSLSYRIHDPRIREHVVRAGRPGNSLAMGKLLGFYKHQLLERHVFHGPRHGADIAGMRGLDEDDADVGGDHLLRLSIGCNTPAALAADITSIAASKKRGFCWLRRSGWVRAALRRLHYHDQRREISSGSLVTVHALLNIAVRAARRAGEVIVRSLNRLDSLTVTAKGRNDFVSEVDTQAEAEIIAIIRKHYPNHAFLAEESGQSGDDDTVWIIDPLDGTTNFLHQNPVFAVSIACQQKGRLEHAVVYDPMRQELFTASRGGGAHLDNRRIRVSKQRGLEGALLATGFPYRANTRYIDAYLAMLKVAMETTAGIRRPGSAALDLAFVAAGRVDAFWEIGLAPWDTAAGTLLIQEAGGRIGTLGGAEYKQEGHVLAGTPKVYTALLEAFAPHVPEEMRAS
jgi:myo-inositol-1(or 4)-monophosphatase